jgi:hypothetical protein
LIPFARRTGSDRPEDLGMILGRDLATWGLLTLLALPVAEFWWQGRRIGRTLDSVERPDSPFASLLGGLAPSRSAPAKSA